MLTKFRQAVPARDWDCGSFEAAPPGDTGPPQGETQPGARKTGGPGALGALKRWLLWFLTFFGIYASSSVCPFCGTPGCPVGAGGAALVGGFFAGLWQYGGMIVNRLKGLIDSRRRGQR
jgi:hypothetical protein